MNDENGKNNNHGGTVAKLWHEYQVRAYGTPFHESSAKVHELKLCFYAAIWEFIELMNSPGTLSDGGDDVTPDDLSFMIGVDKELRTYFDEQERLAGVRGQH